MRSPTAGGEQRRRFEIEYHKLSKDHSVSHPGLSKLQDSVADIYAWQAEREDLLARMLGNLAYT